MIRWMKGVQIIGAVGATRGRAAAKATMMMNFCEGAILKDYSSVGSQRDLLRWVGFNNR